MCRRQSPTEDAGPAPSDLSNSISIEDLLCIITTQVSARRSGFTLDNQIYPLCLSVSSAQGGVIMERIKCCLFF